jgi:hypothetical protein
MMILLLLVMGIRRFHLLGNWIKILLLMKGYMLLHLLKMEIKTRKTMTAGCTRWPSICRPFLQARLLLKISRLIPRWKLIAYGILFIPGTLILTRRKTKPSLMMNMLEVVEVRR